MHCKRAMPWKVHQYEPSEQRSEVAPHGNEPERLQRVGAGKQNRAAASNHLTDRWLEKCEEM